MGSKYLPTNRDQKAAQRFLRQQGNVPVFKKNSAGQTAKKGKKK